MLPIVHCGQTVINSRPPAITSLDSGHREARKSDSKCFIVQQQSISHRIFFYLFTSSVPVLFNVLSPKHAHKAS